ncbi:high mobility group B protein 15-like [Phoenix dactylifera]|uniref:High mobility group B protein 15-like n=1 Tax=Phoenix dactylifera TaxID=42345 RepID=A0A8B7C9M1_PHODC|nr:high mobility group B protein 15-like [Phoenix dactylifera]
MSKYSSCPPPATPPPPKVTPVQTQPSQMLPISPQATYEKVISDERVFMETLQKLHRSAGTKFMVPTMGGRPLNLHRLFAEVTSRGGLEIVIRDRKWKDVVAAFNFPSTITNASFVLRKYYMSLLRSYEQVYYFGNKGSSVSVSAGKPVCKSEPLHPEAGMIIASPAANPVSGSEASQPQVSTTSTEDSSTKDQLRTEIPPLRKGTRVTCEIYEKFEYGYLVTANFGSYTMRGVLYHVPLLPSAIQSSSSYRSRRSQKALSRPRSNMSGYSFFAAEQYAVLKPVYSGKERAVVRHIRYLWSRLTQAEKEVYQEKEMRNRVKQEGDAAAQE